LIINMGLFWMNVAATVALLQAVANEDRAGMLEALRAGAEASATLDGHPVLMLAAMAGDEEVTQALLDRGAPADARESNSGWTSLHHLAMTGRTPAHQRVAELLMRRGADVNAQTPGMKGSPGATPLDLASRFKNDGMYAVLEEHGGIRLLWRNRRRPRDPRPGSPERER
jgi:ankyrin repeat protein